MSSMFELEADPFWTMKKLRRKKKRYLPMYQKSLMNDLKKDNRLKREKIKGWLNKSVSAKYERIKNYLLHSETLSKTWMS